MRSTRLGENADLAAAAAMPLAAVLLPKVESPDRMRLTVSLLDSLGAPEQLAVWSMLETPLGILNAREIAGSSRRLVALVLGTSDLTKDLQAIPTRDRLPLLTSFGIAILAARAHRLSILDGVQPDLADDEEFAAACRQGRELGFDGKTLIHPSHLAICNQAFTPPADEVAWANAVVEAFGRPENATVGALRVENRLAERLHLEQSRRLLAVADAIADADDGG